ncbi:bifunctional fructose-bisphosphatase/inositol-phosphate phosphatase [Methanolobus sp. ZRKC3]|uniref:bifunctional fructose-bisphosphatase/inositol-phosphate phosphatase n=1 Tax=Methanolobus sp. ZRKC3 TaxID=3125786 RepID=UPI0032507E21
MPDAEYLLALCDRIADAANGAIENIVGTPDANKTIYMGADGTPTKLIDDISEKAIFNILEDEGISFRILSEEYGEMVIGNDPEYTMIIDPLDGTYNASFGIPFYSISIAFVRNDINDTYFGYVKNLASGDTFFAQKGKGAFLNGKQLETSTGTDISKYCISVYGYRAHVDRAGTLCKNVRRIRILGSVALELCYVAAGKLDAFVDVRESLRLTDIAAGKLIIEEAGGTVTDGNGAGLKLAGSMVNKVYMVASNGCSHAKLLKLSKGRAHGSK